MVTANGQATRARIREGDSVVCRIDRRHRFIAQKEPQDQIMHDQTLNRVQRQTAALSPATKRVLNAILKQLFVSYTAQSGYTFKPFINRQTIAHGLDRVQLVPYDIKMLRLLVAKGLVQESRHPLPRKRYGDIWLGAGAEYVYHIHENVLFCLLELDYRERDRLAALKRPIQAAQPLPVQPARTTPKPSAVKPKPVPDYLKYKPSLWDRFLDWVGL